MFPYENHQKIFISRIIASYGNLLIENETTELHIIPLFSHRVEISGHGTWRVLNYGDIIQELLNCSSITKKHFGIHGTIS